MQREPVALRTQRRLHQRERLAAPVPPHPCIALPRAFAQCRTALHRRCREFWQQLPTVARVAGAGRVGFEFASGDYQGDLVACASLKAPVDAFFDKVMVNAEDAALRQNRLALLSQLHGLMNRIADLAKLAV